MLVPLLIVAGAVFGGLGASKVAASSAAGAKLLGMKKKEFESERNQRLDINPAFQAFRDRQNKELVAQGLPPIVEDDDLKLIDVDPHLVPDAFAGEWLVLKSEMGRLNQILEQGSMGTFTDDYERLRWASSARLADPVLQGFIQQQREELKKL
jgi:hypothetical protein